MAADKNVILITRLDRDGSKKNFAHGWKQDFQISRQTNSIRQHFCSKFISNLYFFSSSANLGGDQLRQLPKRCYFFAPKRSVPATSIQVTWAVQKWDPNLLLLSIPYHFVHSWMLCQYYEELKSIKNIQIEHSKYSWSLLLRSNARYKCIMLN